MILIDTRLHPLPEKKILLVGSILLRTVITRTCEMDAFFDCQKANNVEYCYCNTELCNKVHPTRLDEVDPEDLEDNEGSGNERDTNDLQEPTNTVTTSRTSNSNILNPINISTLLSGFFVFQVFCDIFLNIK